MDDVAVSSLWVFPDPSCQAMTRATAWAMRVLRRRGPVAEIKGPFCFTGRPLRRSAGKTRFAGQAVKPPRRNQKAPPGERLANRELGTPDLEFHRKYTANPRT